MKTFRTAEERAHERYSIAQCMMLCGAAVNFQDAMSITAFCWANGMDFSLIAFDVMYLSNEIG